VFDYTSVFVAFIQMRRVVCDFFSLALPCHYIFSGVVQDSNKMFLIWSIALNWEVVYRVLRKLLYVCLNLALNTLNAYTVLRRDV